MRIDIDESFDIDSCTKFIEQLADDEELKKCMAELARVKDEIKKQKSYFDNRINNVQKKADLDAKRVKELNSLMTKTNKSVQKIKT